MVALRPVGHGDLDAYVRMRADPVMMSELGGPQDATGLPAKLARDVDAAATDHRWILMILPDEAEPGVVAGTVTLWQHEGEGPAVSEIGWMVLPEFQGQGIATAAVAEVVRRAAEDGRWGPIHAYPAVTNLPSNRLCRRLGFSLAGQRDKLFRGRVFRTNDWTSEWTRTWA